MNHPFLNDMGILTFDGYLLKYDTLLWIGSDTDRLNQNSKIWAI